MIIINIEILSERLTEIIFKDQKLTEVERAKVQYGLSITIGILIELILTLGISMIFKTSFYTAIIMLSALFLRMHTGGAHCTTYDRCLLFTAIYFIPFSILAKFIDIQFSFEIKLLISISLFIVALILLRKFKFPRTIIALLLCTNVLMLFAGIDNIWVKIQLSIAFGLGLQAFMTTSFGTKTVEAADKIMKLLRIN